MRRYVMLIAAGMVMAGCAHRQSAPPTPYADRLAAAKDIGDRPSRDQALHDIAIDAAAAPDVVAVRDALKSISDGTVHDEAAEDAAVRLKQSGQTRAALEVASRINNGQKRDEAMKELSER